jgi:hypothetical protein
LWLLGAAASVTLFAQTWSRAHRPGGIDLTTYLEAARAALRGDNPYALVSPFPYIYPPFLAFALIPLTRLPADLALAAWFAASLGAIVWSTREVLTLAYPELSGRRLTPFIAALFVGMYPVLQSNLRNGQVNPIVVGLVIAALAARLARPGSHHAGGASSAPDARGADGARRPWRPCEACRACRAWEPACWAAAIAIKIVPAALAPFYLRRRDWRVCAEAASGVIVLCLIPFVTLGSHVVPLTRGYVVSFLAGSFSTPAARESLAFSLGGMLTLVGGPIGGPWVGVVAAVLPVAVVFAADWRARTGPTTDPFAYALYLAVIPLASPKSEVHHLLFAMPLATLAFGAWWWRPVSRRPLPVALLGTAAVCYLAATVVAPMNGLSSVLFFLSLVALVGAAIGMMTRLLEMEP